MTVIEILRGGPQRKEFYFRLMGHRYREIWRSSETYKRKATMMKTVNKYCASLLMTGVKVVDLTTKEMQPRMGAKRAARKK